MFNQFSLFVGRRYTRAKRRNNFISFIAATSMLGIALGVTVLITVLSVMNGFEREMRDRVLGMTPHVYVQSFEGRLSAWQDVLAQVEKAPNIKNVAPFITTQAMIVGNGRNHFTLVNGVLPKYYDKVSIVNQHMLQGKLDNLRSKDYGIILGRALAASLGVGMGDKVTIIAVEGASTTPAGIIPRRKRFTVQGIFEIRSEADNNLAFVHLEDAQRLLRYGDKVTAVQAQVHDVLNASRIASDLQGQLKGPYYTSDWTYMHGSLFSAIKMEKNMMFLLLIFIIAVAAFNIVSTLVMVVQDKQADIAILRTLGASPSSIMGIFIIQGSLNGFVGTFLGVAGGVGLSLSLPDIIAAIEHYFDIQFLPGDVYFVSFLPSQLIGSDVVKVAVASLSMAFLATIYPAYRAAKTKPAEALRYE